MNKGITLIELLVVLAIVFIITGVIVVNPGKSRVNLDNAARQFVTDIRSVQNKAMSVDYSEVSLPNPDSELISFNVYWGGSHYFLGYCVDGSTYNYRSADLPEGITIINPPVEKHICFRVPDGATCIGNGNCVLNLPNTDPSYTFILQSSDGQQKRVTVTSAGAIEIQ